MPPSMPPRPEDSTYPLVSVITPFYNTEDHLAECIESVLGQTYTNWKYFLLDNCSTDKSREIAERYAQLYPDQIYLKRNETLLPQVANYNRALSLTLNESKYCKLVQADDRMFPQCLERMVDVAENNSSVGVVGAYGLEGEFVSFHGLPLSLPVVTGRAACRLFFLEDSYLFGSPTQLMLRSNLVLARSSFYDESYIPFEDAAVIFELLKDSEFGFVHQVLTYSRRDNASIMSSMMALNSMEAFQLFMLRQFGTTFLEPEEYRCKLRTKERVYAQLLVDAFVDLRGPEFWKLHRQMLRRMGYRLTSAREWWFIFLSLCDTLLNPKTTVSRFLRALKRKSRALSGAN